MCFIMIDKQLWLTKPHAYAELFCSLPMIPPCSFAANKWSWRASKKATVPSNDLSRSSDAASNPAKPNGGSSFMHEKESYKSFWSGDMTVIRFLSRFQHEAWERTLINNSPAYTLTRAALLHLNGTMVRLRCKERNNSIWPKKKANSSTAREIYKKCSRSMNLFTFLGQPLCTYRLRTRTECTVGFPVKGFCSFVLSVCVFCLVWKK